MRTIPISTTSGDIALDALYAEFLCERLFDAGKTAIAFAQHGQVWVKTDAPEEAFKDACTEADVPYQAFLRVTCPELKEMPRLVA